MSWEDDEIRDFEQRKRDWADRDALILSRSRQRDAQAASCWIELQGSLRGVVVLLNMKADRTLLQVVDSSSNLLRIRREDGVSLNVEYKPALYRATFEYPSCPGHSRDYELRVMPMSGNDTTVWVDQSTKDVEQVAAIGASSIRKLLRCGLA